MNRIQTSHTGSSRARRPAPISRLEYRARHYVISNVTPPQRRARENSIRHQEVNP